VNAPQVIIDLEEYERLRGIEKAKQQSENETVRAWLERHLDKTASCQIFNMTRSGRTDLNQELELHANALRTFIEWTRSNLE
jgi:hypothetical protein